MVRALLAAGAVFLTTNAASAETFSLGDKVVEGGHRNYYVLLRGCHPIRNRMTVSFVLTISGGRNGMMELGPRDRFHFNGVIYEVTDIDNDACTLTIEEYGS